MTPRALEDLLIAQTPFLDVRSPGEFAGGAVPGAVNLPLLEDEERRGVGTVYKAQGHQAAVALGHELVSGEVRRNRVRAWRAFAEQRPDAWIYCWRGGQRSEIVQRWLQDSGLHLPRVPGGFKALRHACMAALERAPREKHWLVLGGRTGTGKTEVLTTLPNAVDLEGLACHRGSAFGAHESPQPTPVTFENALATAFLQHEQETLVLEDESRTIGRLALPQGWHERMQSAPVAVLQVPMAQRIANIAREYVHEPLARGVPERALYARYSDAVSRIQRRLGGARRQAVQAALDRGFARGDHGPWIEQLLSGYYDPMYDHQLERKRRRVVVEGGPEHVRTYLAESCALQAAR